MRRTVVSLVGALVIPFGYACAAGCSKHAPAGADPASPTAAASAASNGAAEAPISLEPPTQWPVRPLQTDGAYVYSKSRFLYVYPQPSTRSKWIGYLWIAAAVKEKGSAPIKAKKGSGCTGSFHEIEPRGFVCVDGEHATNDPKDPVYLELLKHAPDVSSPWPYIYGVSKGENRMFELDGVEQPKWPSGLQDERQKELPPRSTVAWTGEVKTRAGLPYLWLSDLTFLHHDSVEPYPRVPFHGLRLGGDVQLPLAFFRRVNRPKLKRDGDNFTPTGQEWPRLAWVKLTGKSEKVGDQTYWETTDNGYWLEAHDTAIVQPRSDSNPWKKPIKKVSSGTLHKGEEGRRTWVEVAALHGWMIAYEDDEPVYATMISGGKLGAAVPQASEPHQPPATTPIGHFKVDTKFITTTLKAELSDGTDYIHSEVPWSQHFYSKYLLHTAYWHDNWGEGRSGGCVNMSPIDAKFLFDWSQPEVPEGWHAYRTKAANNPRSKYLDMDGDPATVVIVHR